LLKIGWLAYRDWKRDGQVAEPFVYAGRYCKLLSLAQTSGRSFKGFVVAARCGRDRRTPKCKS
jgi:hypothetical protein